MSGAILGAVFSLGQQVFFAAEIMLVHLVGAKLNVAQIAMLRSVGGLILVVVITRGTILPAFRTQQIWLQILRGFSSAGYLSVFAYSFTSMPLADATALSFFSAVYVVILAPFILDEHVGTRKWIAASIGLLGVFLIIKPGYPTFSWTYFVVLVGTSLNGIATILTKRLERHNSPVSIMLYLNIIGILSYLPFDIGHDMQIPSPAFVVPLLLLGPLGQYCGILALKFSDASTNAAFSYARLILTNAAAWIVFREKIEMVDLLGQFFIIWSCVLAVFNPLPGLFLIGKKVGIVSE